MQATFDLDLLMSVNALLSSTFYVPGPRILIAERARTHPGSITTCHTDSQPYIHEHLQVLTASLQVQKALGNRTSLACGSWQTSAANGALLCCQISSPLDTHACLVLQLGNFSYTVNMHADPAEVKTIPQLQACLGSTARHVVDLQNPVGTEVVLQTSCSNPHNFTLSSAAVVLPPYGQAEMTVDYLPSSLGMSTQCGQSCH